MKILVAGAKGFIGKNLVATLNNIRSGKEQSYGRLDDLTIFEYDVDTDIDLLDIYCSQCDFVYNLAGVNRPKEENEFMEGNFGFVTTLLDRLKKYDNRCPIMLSSSIQAELENLYGRSKKAGEDLIFDYGREAGTEVYVYRFPNVFGKWCRPNYNSVIATFCNNIAHDCPIRVNNRATVLNLVYIDDVVRELIGILKGKAHKKDNGYCYVPVTHESSLGEIVDLLYSFKDSRRSLLIPDMPEESLAKKLYATYLSYLPDDEFSYPLQMHVDQRGSFTEIFKTLSCGQVSVNIIKPGIEKGNHWHHTKNEKFVAVSGKGLIQFRKKGEDKIVEYYVCGEQLQVVDIPTGYVHNIINEGDEDLIMLIWSNECFNPNRPDTISEKI